MSHVEFAPTNFVAAIGQLATPRRMSFIAGTKSDRQLPLLRT